MKTLSEYVKDINIVEDYIDQIFLKHLAISYKCNNLYNRNRILLEKYGIYDGCEELAKYLAKVVSSTEDTKIVIEKDKLKDFKNIFYDKIKISFKYSDTEEYAEFKDMSSLNEEKMFDYIKIEVVRSDRNRYDLAETFMHELTHAYDNWKTLFKEDDSYIRIATSPEYLRMTDFSDISNDEEEFIKEALYLLTGYERNAFVAQLKGELDKHKEEIKSPHDALKILKDSSVYQTYKYIRWKIEEFFQHKLSEKEQRNIEVAYKEITNEQKTANQIFKKLRSLSDKVLNKLDTQLPKMCLENLNNITIRKCVSIKQINHKNI